jgi:hypothetical protein
MCPRHGGEVDGLPSFLAAELAISLIVSKTVFDTHDDPALRVSRALATRRGEFVSSESEATYQRLVNTTPKPRATKNNKGELVALFDPDCSPLLPAVVVAALLAADVGVGDISTVKREKRAPRAYLMKG